MGQAVVATITHYPTQTDGSLSARVMHVLGDPEDPRTAIIDQIVLSRPGADGVLPWDLNVIVLIGGASLDFYVAPRTGSADDVPAGCESASWRWWKTRHAAACGMMRIRARGSRRGFPSSRRGRVRPSPWPMSCWRAVETF